MFSKGGDFSPGQPRPRSQDTVPKVDFRVAIHNSKPTNQKFTMAQKIRRRTGITASRTPKKVCKELDLIARTIKHSGGISSNIPQRLHRIAYELTPKPISITFGTLKKYDLDFIGIECACEVGGICLDEDSFWRLSSEAARRDEDGLWTPRFFEGYLADAGIDMIMGNTKSDTSNLIYSFHCRVRSMIMPSLSSSFTMISERKLYLKAATGSFELFGYLGYTAGIIPPSLKGEFFHHPSSVSREQKKRINLFLIEAKKVDTVLKDCIPQLVGELYVLAHEIGKDVTRGVITDGVRWMFVILKKTREGRARYWFSKELSIRSRMGIDIARCHFVTGVLARWVEAAHEDLDQIDKIIFNAN